MPNLLEYLTKPNLKVDRSGLRQGPNTFPIGDYEIEGLQPWPDFTYDTVMQCFGDILTTPIDSARLVEPPPIAEHYLQLIDEASVEFILTKHNHTIVDCALNIAQELMAERGFDFPVSWCPGSLSDNQEDPRLRPDWAIVHHSARPPFTVRCPGEAQPELARPNVTWRYQGNPALFTGFAHVQIAP